MLYYKAEPMVLQCRKKILNNYNNDQFGSSYLHGNWSCACALSLKYISRSSKSTINTEYVIILPASALHGHLMKHSGHKSYKCNICDYVIGYWATVNRHKIKYTRERPNKCDLCEFLRYGPFDIQGGGGGPWVFGPDKDIFSDKIGARLFFSPALLVGLFFFNLKLHL